MQRWEECKGMFLREECKGMYLNQECVSQTYMYEVLQAVHVCRWRNPSMLWPDG